MGNGKGLFASPFEMPESSTALGQEGRGAGVFLDFPLRWGIALPFSFG